MPLPPPPELRRIDMMDHGCRWQVLRLRDDGVGLLRVWKHAQWGEPLRLQPADVGTLLKAWRTYARTETRYSIHDSDVAWGLRPPGAEGRLDAE